MGVKNAEIESHQLEIVLETMGMGDIRQRETVKRERVLNGILRLPIFKWQDSDLD